MTPGARPLAGEDRAATGDVARFDRRGVERIHVAQVGDDDGHVTGVQRARWHPRGRAGPDAALEIELDDSVPKGAPPRVAPADRVALRAVTGDAPRAVQRRPV